MNSGFTCITCHMLFATNDIQKAHYQSDWHRYNLRRQTVGMAPITIEDYEGKVAIFNKPAEVAEAQTFHCAACKKTFSSTNSYDTHCRSKKHMEEISKTKKKGPKQPKKKVVVVEKMEVDEKKEEEKKNDIVDEEVVDEGEDDDDSEGWHTDHGSDDEDNDNEEDYNLNESEALPPNSCLFCAHSSTSLDGSLDHMKNQHDFSIPDKQFCCDIDGLMSYLALKVGAGRMCIFCPERRASFVSIDATQKHMRDKQHCRLDRSAESMIELADYYDYDALYEDMESKGAGDVEDDGWSLTLPSGAKIGHRSLVRFYRQNLKTVEVSSSYKSRAAIEKARGIYSALAWTGCTGAVAHRAAKDLQYIARVRRRFELRVGVKSNKLFFSRGRSDQ